MKTILFVTFCTGALAVHPAFADDAHHKNAREVVIAQAVLMTEAEVRKVDKAAKKITLRHGPISNLDMPAMTMVFQVTDPAMLDQVAAGDKVRFAADKAGSGYSVTRIEPLMADDAPKPYAAVVAQAATAMTEAEVRKVDKSAKKITLKHAPIENLDMPAMTMVFQVADPAMLEGFKAGDKVRFSADKVGSGYAITKIESQQ